MNVCIHVHRAAYFFETLLHYRTYSLMWYALSYCTRESQVVRVRFLTMDRTKF